MALTNPTIKNAAPKGKTYRLYDSLGLYLEVSAKGHKWWRFKYRFGGREKRLALGVYPEVSLKEARESRDRARIMLRDGVDPSKQKQVVKAAQKAHETNSFEFVAREWHTKMSATWSSGHAVKQIQRLEKHVFPWIGKEPLDSLEPPELLKVLRRIESNGTLETAHRILTILGQTFRYGVATGRIRSDPTRDLRGALRTASPTHLAAITDPKELGRLLLMMDAYQGAFVTKCALKLAPLVFVRPGELRRARWEDIDLDRAEWRYTVTKTRTEHIVPLSRQAVAILKDLHPLTQDDGWVFPGARPNGRPMSNNAVLTALRAMGIAKDTMTGHGFRATARTLLDEALGERVELIEHQLAHAVKDPLGVAYNRTKHLPARKKMMQRWADYLDELRASAAG